MQVLAHAAERLAELRVGLDARGNLRRAGGLADLMRDVAEVTERARGVPLLDRSVQLFRLPAPYDVDEVLHVAVGALELLYDLARLVVRRRAEVLRRDEVPILAVDHVADVDAAVVVHAAGAAALVQCRVPSGSDDPRLLRQTAHLEDQ